MRQGRIVNIHERAVPQSDAIIAAAAPVRAVIELNGGTAARLDIKPGDRVLFPDLRLGFVIYRLLVSSLANRVSYKKPRTRSRKASSRS